MPVERASGDIAILIDISPVVLLPRRNSRQLIVALRGETVLDLDVAERSVFLISVNSTIYPDGPSDENILGF